MDIYSGYNSGQGTTEREAVEKPAIGDDRGLPRVTILFVI
jgi:hypothetical protein